MCESNKKVFLILLLVLLFLSVVGMLRAGEREPWYLISETELLSIEKYKENCEQERRTWLLQARELEAQAERLKTQAVSLRQDSETLNDQLAQARERNRELQRSFNEYEAGQLIRLSLKNGEIANLKKEAEKHKGTARSRLVVIAALGAAWVILIAFKVRRFFGS
ncbi:MAG: hypothetical protein LBD44_02890 [Spirochaetaceae bacterium]|jgi:TolA-binding protein|nr:hypothetical protein [Spirochaetaceae bacterium]